MNEGDNKTVGTIYSADTSEDAPIVEYDANRNAAGDAQGSGDQPAGDSQMVTREASDNSSSTPTTKPNKGTFAMTSSRKVEPVDDSHMAAMDAAMDKQANANIEANESGGANNNNDGGSGGGKAGLLMVVLLLLAITIGGFTYFLVMWFRNRAEIASLNSSKDKLLSVAGQCEQLQVDYEILLAENKNLTDHLNRTQSELTNENMICEEERIRLEDLVANLTEKIDNLSGDVNQYEILNAQLYSNIDDLSAQNQILNGTVVYYEELNKRLNASLNEMDNEVTALIRENEVYKQLNEELNNTKTNLTLQVERLEATIDNLEDKNQNLDLLVTQLSAEVAMLTKMNENMNNSVLDLETQVDNLSTEIDRLEALNGNLANVVSFVNETAGNIDESVDAITEFLSEQITAYRSLLLETIQNTYSQRIANWDCAYRDMFRLEGFVNDDRLPVGADAYPKVIEYIEERVLSELCLSRFDFEQYLETQYVKQGSLPPVSVTGDNLVMGIQLYSMSAMNYYFAEENGGGLTKADWAEASYECSNLPGDKRFSMA